MLGDGCSEEGDAGLVAAGGEMRQKLAFGRRLAVSRMNSSRRPESTRDLHHSCSGIEEYS